MKRTISLALATLLGVGAFAEGYQVNLQGARQTGMGHAGTGLSFGASSMHFNPGALVLMKNKYDFSVGGSAIFASNVFQMQSPSSYQTATDNPLGTPFFAYAAGKITDNLAFGLSVTTPYGNSLAWEEDWAGRYLIQDISLKAIYFQPTVSYALNSKLSVGAGFVFATGDVELHKAVPVEGGLGDGQAELIGSTSNYGYNIGVFYQASEKLSIGVDYRSEIVMEMDEGSATFTVPTSLATSFPTTTFSAALPMPANLVVGAGYKVNDKLLLALDFQYIFWAAYDSLVFDFAASTVPDSHNARNFENSYAIRLGAEYQLSPKFMVRAGGAYDKTPIPEGYLTPETPGADKINLTCGLSYQLNEKLSFDASFMYVQAMERKDGYESLGFYGTYNTNAFIPGFAINYNF